MPDLVKRRKIITTDVLIIWHGSQSSIKLISWCWNTQILEEKVSYSNKLIRERPPLLWTSRSIRTSRLDFCVSRVIRDRNLEIIIVVLIGPPLELLVVLRPLFFTPVSAIPWFWISEGCRFVLCDLFFMALAINLGAKWVVQWSWG